MSEENEKSVNISIDGILLTDFFMDSKFQIKENESIDLDINNNFGLNFQKNENKLRIEVTVNILKKETDSLLSTIKVINIFVVQDLEQFQIEGTNDKFDLPVQAFATMLGISYTHTRALFADRIRGLQLSSVVLPIINPMIAAKDILKKFKEES